MRKPKLNKRDFRYLSWAIDTLQEEIVAMSDKPDIGDNNKQYLEYQQDLENLNNLSFKLSKIEKENPR